MRRAPFDGWAKRDGVLERLHPWLESVTGVNNAGLAAWTWSAYSNLSVPGSSTAVSFVPHGLHVGINLRTLDGFTDTRGRQRC